MGTPSIWNGMCVMPIYVLRRIYTTYEIPIKASESKRGHNQIIELMFHVYTDVGLRHRCSDSVSVNAL